MEKEPKKTPDRYICLFFEQCNFVQDNAERMPELIQRTQERFCMVQDSKCARRQLYETWGAEVVPPLMLPEQTDWAKQIRDECEGDRTENSRAASVQ
jgi:hypothetical protein